MANTAEQIKAYQTRAINAAKSVGVPDVNAQIIASQATHESGKFSSNLFVKDNNCFGMKVPSVRKTPYIAGKGIAAPVSEGQTPYAHYNSMEDSVKDLVSWCTYNKVKWADVATPDTYAAWLKSKGYYGDAYTTYAKRVGEYLASIKTWAAANRNNLALIAGALLCVLAFVSFKTL